MRLRTAWLDVIIGWNQGVQIRASRKLGRARAREQRAREAWDALHGYRPKADR